jgi:hypothetical protein
MHKCLDITFRNKIPNYDPATDEQILTSHMLNIPAPDDTYARLTCMIKIDNFVFTRMFRYDYVRGLLATTQYTILLPNLYIQQQRTQIQGAKSYIWYREEATGGRKNLHSNNIHNFHSFTKYY